MILRLCAAVLFIISYCYPGSDLYGQHRITGTVVTGPARHPVRDVLVACYPQDSLSNGFTSVLTDSAGLFTFTVKDGRYNFEAVFAGNVCWSREIDVSGPVDLSVILIDTAASDVLEGTGIRERKQVLSIEQGKLVYHPPMQSVGSAFDILKTAPNVFATDESIQISGKGDAGIMINGRWERMPVAQVIDYLKSLPAERVEKIEIIRNPYAETDAENRSGYINIVLKGKWDRGISGTANAHTRNASLFSYGAGINLNGNTGKWQYGLNVSASEDRNTTNGSNILHFPDKYWVDSSRQVTSSRPLIFSVNADYRISEQHAVGGSLYWSRTPVSVSENNPSGIYNKSYTVLDSMLRTTGINPSLNNMGSANLNYTFDIDSSGKKLRLDIDHFSQWFDRKQDFTNYEYDNAGDETKAAQRYESGNEQLMAITTANLAVDLPVRWARLSFGGKLTSIRNINSTSFYERKGATWQPDHSRFDHFRYFENTQALYAKADRKVGKWTFMAGVRAENTQTRGVSEVYKIENTNRYLKLFPSADISYEYAPGNVLNAGYSRRIDRPMFVQVNPFRWYHTKYAFTHGNPSLQPSFSHNIELNYMLQMKWNFNAGYSRVNQMFSEIDLVDPVRHTRETLVDNILDIDIYNVQVSTSFNIRNRWLLYPQAGVSYTRVFSKVDYLQYSAGYFGYAAVYQQIALDKKRKFLLDLNTYYYAPRNYGVMQFKTLWAQSATITYGIADNRWQLSITANDIFRTSGMRYNSIVNETLRERSVYRDQQSVALTIRYNFKYGQQNAKKEKPVSNEEEMRRAGR
ncbi:MAG: hypothetical protein BGO09_02695 [Bacteroidetes bacterium 47-18]|nr:MAG: hypothetical protein BGO09_02695 [Bacteroidetes bacterium 47-18]